MLLRSVDIDGLRKAGTAPPAVVPTGITLVAAAELACSIAQQTARGDQRLRQLAARWFEKTPIWNRMLQWVLDGVRPPIADTLSAPPSDLWAIQNRDDVTSRPWTEFQDRFRRSAAANGFSSNLGAALSLALQEMGDNIFQHSNGARGFVAFQVLDRCVHWCAVDVGQGVLSSLRSVPRWSSLATAEAALLAVWRDQATSRPESNAGTGFRQVERSIAALNGTLRFRTGDAVLELSGVTGALGSTLRSNPTLLGLQVGVSCAIGNNPRVTSVTD